MVTYFQYCAEFALYIDSVIRTETIRSWCTQL